MTENEIITQFDRAYYLSQPPELRELLDGATGGSYNPPGAPGGNSKTPVNPALAAYESEEARQTRAVQLATKGFLIDTQIMIWGWDAYKVMKLRLAYGYTWVPSALQPPVQMAPGLTQPGSTLTPYDPLHPPPGAIKVSTNPADFPPFDPPAPPPAVTNDPVGGLNVGNIYYSVPGEAYSDGARVSDARGTFVKHVVIYPFGRTGYWELLPSN